VNMGMVKEEQLRINRNKAYVSKGASAVIDWVPVTKVFEKTSREDLSQKIADSILQTGSRINSAVMDSYIAKDSRESFIKSAVIQMMATPEYQLC